MFALRSFRSVLPAKRALSTVVAPATTALPVSLANIEASWKTLTEAERNETFKALEELQKQDWKTLSLDVKKASYHIAFGPHGPREPILAPGGGTKIFGGIIFSICAAGGLFYTVRLFGSPAPKTMTKEWQEASTARAIEQKQDPFTGPASPGYSGKGYVQVEK